MLAFVLMFGFGGAVAGLGAWFAFGFAGGLAGGFRAGLTLGLALAFAFGGIPSATWLAFTKFAQLARLWRTPIRLMQFLEDARERDVLRTVGPVYQFRHARLQDRLAGQPFATGPNRFGGRLRSAPSRSGNTQAAQRATAESLRTRLDTARAGHARLLAEETRLRQQIVRLLSEQHARTAPPHQPATAETDPATRTEPHAGDRSTQDTD